MKLIRIALIAAALSVLSAASQAQIIIHWLPIFTNYVANPGFESGTTHWNLSNSYFEGDEITYMNLGTPTKDPHSGTWALDLNLGWGYGYNGYYHSDLRQTLATPVPVSSLYYGYIWCQASGNYINMYVTYTDNTATSGYYNIESAGAAPGTNGYIEWNFLPLLNPNKTIKSIEFYADSFEGGDMVIDDIALTTLTWIYIN